MPNRLGVLALLLSLAALAGCATTGSVPDIPAKLYDDKGLLVARLYVPGTLAWENAQINIDGRLHSSNVRDGYVGIALTPGEHHFVQLRVEGRQLSSAEPHESGFRLVRGGGGGYRAPTYIYTPGHTVTTYYTTLSVDRKFVIEAGKVTNLGLIVYIPETAAAGGGAPAPAAGQGKRFMVVNVDNNTEMKSYLATNYPELMASVGEQSVRIAPGKYLDPARLPDLRRVIAAHELRSKTPKIVSNSAMTVAYGDAGTLVMVNKAAGSQAKPQALDTGTLADIVDALRDEERLLFLTSEGKLLSLDNGKLGVAGVPFRIHAVRLAAFSDGGLAIIDNHLRVLRSRDRGVTWTRYENAMIETPRNDMAITGDVDNLYVMVGSRGMPSAILNLRSGDSGPTVIAPPSGSGVGVPRLIPREAGLFLVFTLSELYFRAHSGGEWKRLSAPGKKCNPIVFDDPAGRKLNMECDGVKYESRDSGASWAKLAI